MAQKGSSKAPREDIKNFLSTKNVKDFVRMLLNLNLIDANDINDICRSLDKQTNCPFYDVQESRDNKNSFVILQKL